MPATPHHHPVSNPVAEVASVLRLDVAEDRIISATGELDAATAPNLQACLERLHGAAPTGYPLQVDLSGITFCDSTGISTLIWAYNTLTRADADQAVLINPSPRLSALLAITGLQHLLDTPHTTAGPGG